MNNPQDPYDFTSREALLETFRSLGYRVQLVEWDFSDLPDRARGLIRSMELLCHYDGPAPFQAFLIELNAKRIHRTDLRAILDPFYRRYPQGEYLFAFTPVGSITAKAYSTIALVSPKRIRREEGLAPKLQLRILTLDPSHLYHTDLWVLRQVRLEPHEQRADVIWRKHLAAFDVERVTHDFYKGYKVVLATLEGELARQKHVGAKPIEIHAFAQQLLNRLMFLYFIQKKGWLRQGDGTPDTHYLSNLWQTYRDGQCPTRRTTKAGFYTHWLRLLLLDAFNKRITDIRAAPYLPQEIKESFLRMPYLNGGLFEENELDRCGFSVPDRYFEMLFDRFQEEEPGFLERYNFTVDESTPLEVEVAVDPEMLGKVYESLIAEEDRHRGGIFYTPREEIDYMCRLALIEYLHDQTSFSKDDLIPLVMEPHRLTERGSASFPRFSAKRLREIDRALEKVRAVDPAVGSGSFLVGMMRVLVEVQQAIAQKLERKRFNEFDLKRRIIMENLYGVDVKEWAVRVCELRLWLALTIEVEEQAVSLWTNPILPKLSFRVRQGDSLVEEVAGVPLVLRGTYAHILPQLGHKLNKLAQMKADYFGGRSPLKRKWIEREESKLLQGVLNAAIDRLNRELGALRQPLEEQAAFEGLRVMIPRQLQLDEKRRKSQIRALTQQRDGLIKVRTSLAKGKTSPVFLWDVGFGEVFAEKGGFDIVIGNPPYVRQEEIGPPTESPHNYSPDEWRGRKKGYKDQLAGGVQALWGSAVKVSHRSDLYVYFYHAGLSLLREGGVFCFINSNSWLDVGYGAQLQDFLLRRMRILQVIDNRAKRSFAESDVNTVIVLLQRPRKDESCWDNVGRFVAYKKPFEEAVTASNLLAIERAREVTRSDDLRVYPITQRDLLLDGAERPEEAKQAAMDFAALDALKYKGGKWGGKFLRAPDIFFTVLEKGKGKLVRLGDIAKVRFGIKTGANKFFYLEPTGQPAPEGLVHVRNGAGWEGYLEAEFLKSVIKSPREVRTIQVHLEDLHYMLFMCHKSKDELRRDGQTHALAYIEWGEKQGYHKRPTCGSRPRWWDLGQRHAPPIVSPSSVTDLYRAFDNAASVLIDKRLYEVYCSAEDKARLVTALNSTISTLFLELGSRTGLGQGLLDLTVYEVADCYVLSPSHVSEQPPRIGRQIKSLFEELGLPKPNRDYSNMHPDDISLDKVLPDRRALDEVVFEALGLTEEEQLAVYRAVVELVKNRLVKARSV